MASRHVTILGAGIVGVATASYLQRDGHAVTLVDALPPGEYCSFGNAGILSPGSCVPLSLPGILGKVPGYLADPLGPLSLRLGYLPKALPWLLRFLAAADLRRVEQIADALRSLLRQTFDAYDPLVRDAGIANMIHDSGYAVVYSSAGAMQDDALGWRLRRDRGVEMEELGAADIRRLLPDLAGDWQRGLFLHGHGWCVNPERLVKSLAAHVQRNGGHVLQRRVMDIVFEDGRPSALATDAGLLPLDTLVICAGAHSARFAARLGDTVPLEAERGYHMTFADPRHTLPMPVMVPEHKCFITPMEMGLRIAGQSEFAGIDAAPDYRRADILGNLLQRWIPGLSAADATRWMGRRPSTPDSLPVIGQATRFANVWYGFGHGHVGLCGGAPTGRMLADLMAGRPTIAPAAPFQVDRF